jgi:hypothetical protein
MFNTGAMLHISNSVFENNLALRQDGILGMGGALLHAWGTVNDVHSVFLNNRAGGTNDMGGGAIRVYAGTMHCTNVTLLHNIANSANMPNSNGIAVEAGTS